MPKIDIESFGHHPRYLSVLVRDKRLTWLYDSEKVWVWIQGQTYNLMTLCQPLCMRRSGTRRHSSAGSAHFWLEPDRTHLSAVTHCLGQWVILICQDSTPVFFICFFTLGLTLKRRLAYGRWRLRTPRKDLCDESDDGCDDAARLCALKLTSELGGQAEGDRNSSISRSWRWNCLHNLKGLKIISPLDVVVVRRMFTKTNQLSAGPRQPPAALILHWANKDAADITGPSPFCGRCQVTK